MALLLSVVVFATWASATPANLTTAPSSLRTLPLPQLSAPPAWTRDEVATCAVEFSRGNIDPWDCLQALTKFLSGSAPRRFRNNVPVGGPDELPFYAIHDTCTMKFEASGRNASSLEFVSFRPSQMREMASFVYKNCVLKDELGGFVTRQIQNTAKYLNDPNVDADFVHGFPTETTFFTLSVTFSDIDYDEYNPGNNDPEVANVLDDGVRTAALKFPEGKERDLLLGRSDWMQRAFDKMDRDSQVNWWDYYALGADSTLVRGLNTTGATCEHSVCGEVS